ncbi:polyprenyl synthetase family protein [Macrococcoides caseolyticum]|uniref:polyprenyl synthetase family protein n=1 Tax=Macrococcoides caseolyticum TaxID=69966 RepID=UPI001F278FBF|nr:farnesyl diphosphate synthase [Macrococcus caseolyticus]MCE4956086.1 polyprenyl synthetase family protein [Macrococcus caseolyticus]
MNKAYIQSINQAISDLYQMPPVSQQLNASITYSLQAGGKRIRPLLLMTTIESLGGEPELGKAFGLAVEMIHTYSLVHDDLPAMDNDDYRRGKLTNHKVYGEATAILAGDALLTDSFSQILNADYDLMTQISLLKLLVNAAGSKGMVAGQMLDMESENKNIELKLLEKIHHHKTGDLIHASIYAAGIILKCSSDRLTQLDKIGRNVGLMFQIKDDILDVEGDFEVIGKRVGSDVENQKSTYVTIIGLEKAKEMLEELWRETEDLVQSMTVNPAPLIELIHFIVSRNK